MEELTSTLYNQFQNHDETLLSFDRVECFYDVCGEQLIMPRKIISRFLPSDRKLIKKEKLGVLSVFGRTYPMNFLMAYAASPDLKHFYFATSIHTEKYRLLKKHPSVSILIDNRENRPSDFRRATALSVLGKCAELKRAARDQALDLLLKRHPALKKFLKDDQTSFFSLKVSKFVLVNSFQR